MENSYSRFEVTYTSCQKLICSMILIFTESSDCIASNAPAHWYSRFEDSNTQPLLVFFESLGWVGGAGKGGHLYGYNNDVS
jgi:hypothetical protein